MDREKVAKAANLCIERCSQTEQPLIALAAFIKGMQQGRGWTPDEIVAVRERAAHALLKRIEESEA